MVDGEVEGKGGGTDEEVLRGVAGSAGGVAGEIAVAGDAVVAVEDPDGFGRVDGDTDGAGATAIRTSVGFSAGGGHVGDVGSGVKEAAGVGDPDGGVAIVECESGGAVDGGGLEIGVGDSGGVEDGDIGAEQVGDEDEALAIDGDALRDGERSAAEEAGGAGEQGAGGRDFGDAAMGGAVEEDRGPGISLGVDIDSRGSTAGGDGAAVIADGDGEV